MTNELGTTIQDIEDKAKLKREAINNLDRLCIYGKKLNAADAMLCHQIILKYIEEN